MQFKTMILIYSDYIFVLTIFISCFGPNSCENQHSNELVHSRSKRYLAFPEGSSFSVAVCTTIGQIGNPNVNYMSYALNWGISYNLPNESWVVQHAHGFKNTIVVEDDRPAALVQRRSRRSLYDEIEAILDSMGYNGRDCIMRALCESRKMFSDKIGTMEEELLKKIFNFPSEVVLPREPRTVHQYDEAFRQDRSILDCASSFPACGFSLIALAFGKHSNSLFNFM